MAISFQPKLGANYRIKFHAPAILGTGMENAKITGVVSYEEAQRTLDVRGLHYGALPSLPAGTPGNPADLVYVKATSSAGIQTVFAIDWLASAPEELSSGTASVTITNVSVADLRIIREVLIQAGYPNLTVSMAGKS